MRSIIFSIFIDIPEEDLDNPGWYNAKGEMQDSDKSKETKDYFAKYSHKLKARQAEYARIIGVSFFKC